MKQDVLFFRDNYFFLSNMYDIPVTYNGVTYNNSESAYQAMKCLNKKSMIKFINISGIEAKSKISKLKTRSDWKQVKEEIMYEICKAKFSQNLIIKSKLLATGNCLLEEGNTWGDIEWGTCCRKGENKLGKILMRIREELKGELI